MKNPAPRIFLTIATMISCGALMLAGCGSDSSAPHTAVGYAVGMNSLLHTSDGATWQSPNATGAPSEVGIDSLYNDVSAVDNQCAWAVGSTKLGGKVLRTLDGGLTWTKLAPAAAFSPPTLTQGIKAVARDTAWVVGDISTVALTTDGGQSWKQFDNLGISPDTPALFLAVTALDANTAWAVGNDRGGNPLGVYTTDGGASWKKMEVSAMTAGKPLLSVSAVDKNSVWVSQQGPGSGVYVSTDGGATFSTAYPDPGIIGDCFTVVGLSANAAFAGFENSSFEMTFDGGRDWAKQSIDGRLNATGLTVAGNGIWVTGTYPDGDPQAGEGAIHYSGNGGVTWTKQTPTGTPGLTGVSFVGGRK